MSYKVGFPMADKNNVRAGFPVLSDSQESDVQDAIAMLHSIVGGADYSTAENPDSRTAIETSDIGYVFQRCMTALAAKSSAKRHAAMADVKRTLDAKIGEARQQRETVLAEVSGLSLAMRALLGVNEKLAALDVAHIPVSDLLGSFATGTTTTQAVEWLKDGLKLEIANRAPHGSKSKDPVWAVRIVLAQSAVKAA
jgi:hypothetical protein